MVTVPVEYREVLTFLKQQTRVPYAQIVAQALKMYLPTIIPATNGLGFTEKKEPASG